MTEYSQEIVDAMCELIADGKSLRAICAVEGMPTKSLFLKWVSNNVTLRDQYALAREAQADTFFDEVLEISDNSSEDVAGELGIPNGVAVQRARLRVDTRKWAMGKMMPKKYGDKQLLTGADGEGPVQFVVTRAGRKE